MFVQPAKVVQTGEEKFAVTICDRNLTAVCREVLRTEKFHVELQGHAKLFVDQFLFSIASCLFSERTKLYHEAILGDIVSKDFPINVLELIVQSTMCGIHQFLLHYRFDNTTESPDAVFLQSLFKILHEKSMCISKRDLFQRCGR